MRCERTALALSLVLAAAIGCSESRQDRFQHAVEREQAARTDVASAQKQVDQRRKDYERADRAAREAEKQLAEARDRLNAANGRFESAQAEVSKWADDATLFRTLQKRLLEAKGLQDAAVSARVQRGVAILDGTAPDAEARDRAIQVARETPGIVDVESHITVASGSAPAAAPANPAPAAAAPAPSPPPSKTPPEPAPDATPAPPGGGGTQS
jgi:hyperosmotically inducible protein